MNGSPMVVSADLPAWAELMNMKYYTRNFSCHLCDQEGSPYDANNLDRAWPYDEESRVRTHGNQIRNAKHMYARHTF